MAHRWVIVTLCALVFLAIVPLFMFVGKNFLPVDDQSQFEVSVRTPEGSSLGATAQQLEQIAREIRKMDGRDRHAGNDRRRPGTGRQCRYDLRQA